MIENPLGIECLLHVAAQFVAALGAPDRDTFLECPRAAVADFTRYLELAPDAEDATDVRKRLVELQASALRLN